MQCPNCQSTHAIVKNGKDSTTGYQRYKCKSCEHRFRETTTQTKNTPERVKFSNSFKQSSVYVVTSAQNATPVHSGLLTALKAYCKSRSATLLVIPYRYKNPTSLWNQAHDDWWDPEIVPYLYAKRKQLNSNIEIMGDIKIQPTAVTPLSGMEGLGKGLSAIFGHPRLQLKPVPTPQNKLPCILTTTGSITVKNFTDSKAGKKGEFHFTHGAAVVEIQSKTIFHLRQINAMPDGSFIDWDKEYLPDGNIKKVSNSLALTMGDSHLPNIDKKVKEATFGKNGIIEQLNPDQLIWHDILDGYSINPHHKGNPFINYTKHKSNTDSVRDEVLKVIKFLKENTGKRKSIIVGSNHDDFLHRWILNNDWRTEDPKNAEFYLETALAILKNITINTDETVIPSAFSYWVNKLKNNKNIRCLATGESYVIKNIDHGFHGHKGPNGARGNIKNLSSLGVKVTSGHQHCLTANHDVLTETGWIKIAEANPKYLLSYKNGRNIWTRAIEKYQYSYTGKLITIKHRGAFHQEVTPNHNLKLKNQQSINIAQAILTKNAIDLPITAHSLAQTATIGSLNIPEHTLRKIVAVCADGSFDKQYNYLRFHLKKQRKIDRLKKLFKGDLNIGKQLTQNNALRFSVKKDSMSYLEVVKFVNPNDKRLPQEFLKLTPKCRDIVLDELSYWDGTFNKGKQKTKKANQFSTYKEDEALLIGAIITMQGYRCTCVKRKTRKKGDTGWVLSWCNNKQHAFVSKKNYDKYRLQSWGFSTRTVNNELVYCFNTTDECFWVRNRTSGLISLTGNSPGIEGPHFKAGTSTKLKVEYNADAPSSWLNSHVILYRNGKRSLINIIDGHFKI